jgi:hypothetical protein
MTSNGKRRTCWTVVMRETEGSPVAMCVRAVRGPSVTKVQSHPLEAKLVEEYAHSIGCDWCNGRIGARHKDSTFVCILTTYRSFDRNGNGRVASTFTRWVVYRPNDKLTDLRA